MCSLMEFHRKESGARLQEQFQADMEEYLQRLAIQVIKIIEKGGFLAGFKIRMGHVRQMVEVSWDKKRFQNGGM